MPVSELAFGPWEPDKPLHGHAGLTECVNVYPVAGGYAPVGSFAAVTPALTDWTGGGAFIGADGTSVLLGGADDALYSYNGASWTDIYTVAAGRWRFAQNEGLVVGVHGGSPAAYDFSTATAGLLGGTPPDAAYVATVREFTFLAGDPADVLTVSWSGFRNAEIWDGTSQSGSETLPDGGSITGITGGEYGLVFQRGSIHRFQYLGGESVWQRDKISSEAGCIEPGSLAQAGRLVFFLSERGFMRCDGNEVAPIGTERIDRTFFATYPRSELSSLYAATDPRHYLVAWSMPGNPGRVWLYNWALDRWAVLELPLGAVFNGFTSNIGVDGADGIYSGGVDGELEDVPVDSPIFDGGEPRFYVVSAAGVVGTLTGPSLGVSIRTAVNEIVPGRFVRPHRLRLVGDAGATLTARQRARLTDAETVRTAASVGRSGDYPVRANGRYFAWGATVPAGAAWDYVQGIEVEFGLGGAR